MIPPEIGKVIHFSPGRLRLRVDRSLRTREVFDNLRSLLGSLPGVTSLEVNPSTGSVLVLYDPDQLDVAQLLRLGSELGWIPPAGKGLADTPDDWRSYVDLPRVARGATLLAVAGLGALAGPAIGLSARMGSLSASVAYVALTRLARTAKRNGHSPDRRSTSQLA